MLRTPFLLSLILLLALGPRLLAQGPPGPPSPEEKERVRVRIGMSRDQQARIETLWKDTDSKLRDIAQRMSDLRQQLFELYDTYDYDRSRAAGIRREIAGLYARRMAIFADNQEKLRRILTRDQFDRLRAMIKEDRERRRRDWDQHRRDIGPPHGAPPP